MRNIFVRRAEFSSTLLRGNNRAACTLDVYRSLTKLPLNITGFLSLAPSMVSEPLQQDLIEVLCSKSENLVVYPVINKTSQSGD